MAHAWKACWVEALGGSNPPSSAISHVQTLSYDIFDPTISLATTSELLNRPTVDRLQFKVPAGTVQSATNDEGLMERVIEGDFNLYTYKSPRARETAFAPGQ